MGVAARQQALLSVAQTGAASFDAADLFDLPSAVRPRGSGPEYECQVEAPFDGGESQPPQKPAADVVIDALLI